MRLPARGWKPVLREDCVGAVPVLILRSALMFTADDFQYAMENTRLLLATAPADRDVRQHALPVPSV